MNYFASVASIREAEGTVPHQLASAQTLAIKSGLSPIGILRMPGSSGAIFPCLAAPLRETSHGRY
jgi:hypothetical protein